MNDESAVQAYYEYSRLRFLKCEAELARILELFASGESEILDEMESLNTARAEALETYALYAGARGALIAAMVEASATPKRRPVYWPGAKVISLRGVRPAALPSRHNPSRATDLRIA